MAAEPTPGFTEVQLRAVIEIVALVAYADGSLASAELEVLQRRLRDLSANDELLGSLEEILLSVRPTRRPTGAERAQRLQELGACLEEDARRRKAFEIAVEVARAENGVGVREASSLVAAASELGLDAKVALELYGAPTD